MLKIIIKILVNLTMVLLAICYFIDRYSIWNFTISFPIGNLAVFIMGLFSIWLYIDKDEVPILFLWFSPAGAYNHPQRLLGLAVGVSFVVWMVIYHFKGIRL
jgi:hypothetical protein